MRAGPLLTAFRSPKVLSLLDWRFWIIAALCSLAVALLIVVPTDVLPNPWFTRMTPVHTSDRVFWVLRSLLVSTLVATYLLPRALTTQPREARTGFRAGVLGWLAIGCPICNKLIVALLGVSGALEYFGPIQPVLGLLGVLLSTAALAVGLRAFARGRPLPLPANASAREPLG